MVEGLRPPVETAFAGADVEIDALLNPGFLNEAVGDAIWPGVLSDDPPDVIVWMFGVWENAAIRSDSVVDTTEEDWLVTYRDDYVRPVLSQVHASGVPVVWVGMSKVRDDATSAQFAELNAVWQESASAFDSILWIDAFDLLTDDEGDFVEIEAPSLGGFRRVINPDGLHLCAGAGERLGPPVIAAVEDALDLRGDDQWRSDRSWADDPTAYIDGECDEP